VVLTFLVDAAQPWPGEALAPSPARRRTQRVPRSAEPFGWREPSPAARRVPMVGAWHVP